MATLLNFNLRCIVSGEGSSNAAIPARPGFRGEIAFGFPGKVGLICYKLDCNLFSLIHIDIPEKAPALL